MFQFSTPSFLAFTACSSIALFKFNFLPKFFIEFICWSASLAVNSGLLIISADFNEKYLDFEIFYETLNCINTTNNHGYWAHQGAGGRIFKIDDSSILFTTGDFRNRPMAQKLDSEFGKILRINITFEYTCRNINWIEIKINDWI